MIALTFRASCASMRCDPYALVLEIDALMCALVESRPEGRA